jgi:hypothetical protein
MPRGFVEMRFWQLSGSISRNFVAKEKVWREEVSGIGETIRMNEDEMHNHWKNQE